MAGGPHAHEVPCLTCMDEHLVTKATRVREGVESDDYVCERGHAFGVDFLRGPADEPQWPVPDELREAIESA